MLRRIRIAVTAAVAAGVATVALAPPANAQQLVDAGGENGGGGLAFVLLVVTIVIMVGALFFMDHVRRNRLPRNDDDE